MTKQINVLGDVMKKIVLVAAGVIILAVAVLGLSQWNSNRTNNPAAVVSGHPEWAPIMFREGDEIKGVGPELVKMILDELDIESTFPYSGTWDEVQAKARSGEVDMLVAAYKTDERLEYMNYSDTYVTDPIALFVRSDNTFSFNQWEDLIGKRGMGTVGDSYGQDFDTFINDNLDFAVAQTSEEAFDKVESREADYFVYALFAGEREVPAQGRAGRIVNLPNYVAEENFYITISKKSPFANRIDDINRLLERYTSDGTIDRLMEKYKVQ